MARQRARTILCVIGTRPEAVKMAPLITAFQRSASARCRVVLTGQHRELTDSVLDFFDIKPHIDLDFMRLALPLTQLAGRLTKALTGVFNSESPDLVLAQGDTTSVLATALACARRCIRFGHVEAGLRSHSLAAPFPEELNRVVTSHLATVHFAPTISARRNLEREGINPAAIHVTGNPVIDALLAAARRDVPLPVSLGSARRMVLVTAHRRDSFGEPLVRICEAIQELHEQLRRCRVSLAGPSQPEGQAGGNQADEPPSAGAPVRASGVWRVRGSDEAFRDHPHRLRWSARGGARLGQARAGAA